MSDAEAEVPGLPAGWDWDPEALDASLLACVGVEGGADRDPPQPEPTWIVDPERCPVPRMPSFRACGLLGDCRVPGSPPALVEVPPEVATPEHVEPLRFALLLTAVPGATLTPAGGEPGPPPGTLGPAWDVPAEGLPTPVDDPDLEPEDFGPTLQPGIGAAVLYVARWPAPPTPEELGGDLLAELDDPPERWTPPSGGGVPVRVYNLVPGQEYLPGSFVAISRRDDRWVIDAAGTAAAQETDRIHWARANGTIAAPAGNQMTGGAATLYATSPTGLRSASGVVVLAYNGWPNEAVAANSWMRVRFREGVWHIENWSCPAPSP